MKIREFRRVIQKFPETKRRSKGRIGSVNCKFLAKRDLQNPKIKWHLGVYKQASLKNTTVKSSRNPRNSRGFQSRGNQWPKLKHGGTEGVLCVQGQFWGLSDEMGSGRWILDFGKKRQLVRLTVERNEFHRKGVSFGRFWPENEWIFFIFVGLWFEMKIGGGGRKRNLFRRC